jgi:EcoRII C terminal/Restriction endonuclease EcoRII, N-terminal
MNNLSDTVVEAAVKYGAALLKFVAPNDCGLTGSHQRGFYLPKSAWQVFTSISPVRGENLEEPIRIQWQDGQITDSKIKWYGRKKNEYRLTNFGRRREFRFLASDRVGSLLAFIPQSNGEALCFMLDSEEDIETTQAALGVDASLTRWGIYDSEGSSEEQPQGIDCLHSKLQAYVADAEFFPSTAQVSMAALGAIDSCSSPRRGSHDNQLELAVKLEFTLFKLLEEKFLGETIQQGFSDIGSFLTVAQSALQRRRSRAGRSFEHHVENILREAGIPFQTQKNLDGTRPDFVIPDAETYYQSMTERESVFILALKTTCKDRWRQILQEAPNVPRKYLLTLQPGISSNQIQQMLRENVQLVVPSGLHSYYEASQQSHLMSFTDFIEHVRSALELEQTAEAQELTLG